MHGSPSGRRRGTVSLATFFDNRGKKPITIDRARLLGVAGPLELIEVRTRPVRAGVEGQEVGGGGIVATSEARFPTDPFAGHNTVPVPKLFSETGNPDEGLQLLFRIGVGQTPCPMDAPFGDGVLEASGNEPAG